MKLHKLTKLKYDEGGQVQPVGTFSPLAFGAYKPEFVSRLGGLDYFLQEAKDAENNKLKAFNDMKVAKSLETDSDKSRELHQSYENALDNAAKELNNPFSLARYSQRQATDYVNNPLRRNIEESSKNLEESKKKLMATANADQRGTEGLTNIDLITHGLRGGTNEKAESVYSGTAPVIAEHPAEALAKVVPALRHLDKKQWSSLTGQEQTKLAGVGMTEKSWRESTDDTKLEALAKMALGENTNLIRSVEGNAFQDIYEANVGQVGDKEAKRLAYEGYKTKAIGLLGDMQKEAVTMLKQENTGNDKNPFNYDPTKGSDGGGYDHYGNPRVNYYPSVDTKHEKKFLVDTEDLVIPNQEGVKKVEEILKKYPNLSFDDVVKAHGDKNFKLDFFKKYPLLGLDEFQAFRDYESDYKNEKRFRELKKKLITDYGYEPEKVQTYKQIVDAYNLAKKRDLSVANETVAPVNNAVASFMVGHIAPHLRNSQVSINGQDFQEYKKASALLEDVFKGEAAMGQAFKEGKVTYGGIALRPNKSLSEVTPSLEFDYKAGSTIFVTPSTTLRTALQPLANLRLQAINPEHPRKPQTVQMPDGSFNELVYKYKNNVPYLYNITKDEIVPDFGFNSLVEFATHSVLPESLHKVDKSKKGNIHKSFSEDEEDNNPDNE